MDPHRYNFSFSVVIPVYNDAEVLPELHRRLHSALEKLTSDYEIIYVDDGSADFSLQVLKEIQTGDDTVSVIQLDGNFGQTNAIDAGLELATGELIVVMDSDLQDRPEDIETLVQALRSHNVPMAIATWSSRKDHDFKVLASKLFNALANKFSSVRYPPKMRIFRVLRRELIERIKHITVRTAPIIRLLHQSGCVYATVELNRDSRFAGQSGYTISKMLQLCIHRILTFWQPPKKSTYIWGFILGILFILPAGYFHLADRFHVLHVGFGILLICFACLGTAFILTGILSKYLASLAHGWRKQPKYRIAHIYQRTVARKS